MRERSLGERRGTVQRYRHAVLALSFCVRLRLFGFDYLLRRLPGQGGECGAFAEKRQWGNPQD